MAILNTYQDSLFALSLRRLFSSYSGPLIRVIRESDLIEADVLPDENGEISYNSILLKNPNETAAINLGEFLNIGGYNDADSLGSVYKGSLITIYDQSARANHVVYDNYSTASIFVEHSLPVIFPNSTNIIKVNGVPSFFVSGTSKTFTPETLLGTEYSLHFLSGQVDPNPIGFRVLGIDTNGFFTNPYDILLYTNSGTTVFQPSGTTNVFDVNNVYMNTEQCNEAQNNVFEKPTNNNDSTIVNSIEFAFFNNATTQANFSTSVEDPSFYIIGNSFYADIIVYEGYDNIRRLFIEDLYSTAANNTETKLTLSSFSFQEENIQDNSFLARYPNAAAAFSTRNLRGDTDTYTTKILRVRRDVDGLEVDVYADNEGWVSLDSPLEVYPSDVSNATKLGEFLADAGYTDADSLNAPSTATVSAWYDQSKVHASQLPLDVASGAAAAYSVRKLKSDYTGFAFEIKFFDNQGGELSGDSYNISFDDDGFISDTSLAGPVIAEASSGTDPNDIHEARISTWYDQSGNNNHATQTDNAKMPLLWTLASGLVTENGKPAAQFSSGVMTFDSSISLTAGTIIAVAQLYDQPLLGDGSNRMFFDPSGSFVRFQQGGATDEFTGYTDADQVLGFWYRDGTNPSNFYENGTALTRSVTGISNETGTHDGIGTVSGRLFSGYLQEIIIYASDQSDNRTNIEKSINLYYNIYPQDAATQDTTNHQPKIYDSVTGLVTENGRPAVEFLDNADILVSGSATEFNNVLQNELYSVASYGTINVGNQYAGGVKIGGSSRGVMIGTNSSGDNIRYHCDGITFEAAVGGNIAVDTQILHSGTYDGTTRHARLNGASVGTNTDAGTTGTAVAYFIGKHPNLNNVGTDKKVQELILYAAYNGNESNIENNINSAFQIYSAEFRSLLDYIPLATAAYGLRRLSKQYFGPLITIDNGTTTKDFYADFFGNLIVSDIEDFISGGNSSIVKWWDQSANANHLVSTSGHPTLTITNGELIGVDTSNTKTFDIAQIITDMNAVSASNNNLIALYSDAFNDTIDINTTAYTDLKEIIYYV